MLEEIKDGNLMDIQVKKKDLRLHPHLNGIFHHELKKQVATWLKMLVDDWRIRELCQLIAQDDLDRIKETLEKKELNYLPVKDENHNFD